MKIFIRSIYEEYLLWQIWFNLYKELHTTCMHYDNYVSAAVSILLLSKSFYGTFAMST